MTKPISPKPIKSKSANSKAQTSGIAIHKTQFKLSANQKNLAFFVSGKGISVFGSSIYTFAVSLYVLKISGSALSFAANLFLGIVPMLLISPFAGVLADRINKKNLIIAMDILSGLLFLGLYYYIGMKALTIPVIYATTAILTVFSTLFMIAIESAKPALVTEAFLLKINAISKGIDSLSAILGPILGGLAYALFDMRAFILLNAISFLISAISEVFLDFTVTPEQGKSKPSGSFKEDFAEGIDYFKHSAEIKGLTGIFIFINFFLGYSIQVPLPFIINEVYHLAPKSYGLINASFPIGMILGSLIIERFLTKYDFNLILRQMILVMAIASILVGMPLLVSLTVSKSLLTLYYAVLMFIFGFAISFIDIPIVYIFQKKIPDEIRGRILSLVSSGVKIVLPISLLVSGGLIQTIPVFFLPISGGIGAILYTYYLRQKSKLVSSPE